MDRATPPLVLLMGPTASGKSALALELARRFPVEIVSVDSAQVYRGLDIGTAKPDAATRATVPHHLLDLIDPTEAYSAARFSADATTVIAAIRSRGRIPLLCGGTMLYFKALTEGLSDLPAADAKLRAEIDARAQAQGWGALHGELALIDPPTAARVKPSDSQRIQRALEIHALTGRAMSAQLGTRQQAIHGPRLALAWIPVDRAALHRKIEERFLAMLAAGLVEEVRELRRHYALSETLPAMRSVGYRQALAHLEGRIDMARLKRDAIAATRGLAKRQLTWLRGIEAERFDSFAPTATGQAIDSVARRLGLAGNRC